MDMSRRHFLSCLPAGAMLSALPRSAAPAAPHVGCQTNAWAIKPGDFSSFLAVLGEVRTLGFEGFETSFRNVQSQYADAAAARARLAADGRRVLRRAHLPERVRRRGRAWRRWSS